MAPFASTRAPRVWFVGFADSPRRGVLALRSGCILLKHAVVPLRTGKLIMWHGWADQLIMPQGSVDYYDEMVTTVGGGIGKVQDFARVK